MKSFFSSSSISEPRPSPAAAPRLPANLTSGRLLAGNTFWNLIGACSPLLVALVCLPILKRGIGTDRLGLIGLAWVIIGYFGLFDFGLSRALTKLVAEKLGQEQTHDIPQLVWTSLVMMLGIGFVCLAGALLLSRWLITGPLRVPPELRHEALISFYWLSSAIPVVVVTAGLRGILEALQRFRLATAIRVPLGIFTYAGPVLVLPFSHSLVPIMATLVVGRLLAGLAHLWACFHAFPALRESFCFHRASVAPLIRFGGWMTVTNIVGPLMVSFDRFLIGTLLSISAVAYYSVPYEVVSRLNIFPGALAGVLFPAFSTALENNRDRLGFLYESGVKCIFLVMFPATLLLITFAPEGLRVWLGEDFARNSAHATQVLALAIFVNALGQIPFAHIQGAGRPDLTAKLHLLELPLYAAALFYFARTMGITGVALAWFLRVALDSLVLFVISSRILPQERFVSATLPLMALLGIASFGVAASLTGTAPKIAFAVVTSAIALFTMWRWIISPREKMALYNLRGSVDAADSGERE